MKGTTVRKAVNAVTTGSSAVFTAYIHVNSWASSLGYHTPYVKGHEHEASLNMSIQAYVYAKECCIYLE